MHIGLCRILSDPYKIKYAKTNTLKFSYFHRVVKEWNDLPLSLRKIDSINSFKRDLKVHPTQIDQVL